MVRRRPRSSRRRRNDLYCATAERGNLRSRTARPDGRGRGLGCAGRPISAPARAPEQAVPLMRALLMSHAQGNVDHKLKEIMRILLARFAGDKYFASLRSNKARDMGLTETRIDDGCFAYEDDSKGFSEAEKCALRYADLMFLDANQVDEAFYDEMKKHWSEAQIMELGAFIAFHYGMAMFMRSLGAKAAL